MSQLTNEISLYRKLTPSLIERAGFKKGITELSYVLDNETKVISIGDNNTIAINQFDTDWTPSENNLTLKQEFIIENPSELFAEKGIALDSSVIGMAVHVHSKTASMQKTIKIGTINNITSPKQIEFNYVFDQATLRGKMELDFFMYLDKVEESKTGYASSVGMILSDRELEKLVLIADGDGSVFPMSEFEDATGPLWRLEKNWLDADTDLFNSSNVNLSLNIKHPSFKTLKDGKTGVSRLAMGDILVQAMTMIIQQVMIIEDFKGKTTEEAESGSILEAVNYWVATFNVDTTSIFSINNSMKAYWDRTMYRGDTE